MDHEIVSNTLIIVKSVVIDYSIGSDYTTIYYLLQKGLELKLAKQDRNESEESSLDDNEYFIGGIRDCRQNSGNNFYLIHWYVFIYIIHLYVGKHVDIMNILMQGWIPF